MSSAYVQIYIKSSINNLQLLQERQKRNTDSFHKNFQLYSNKAEKLQPDNSEIQDIIARYYLSQRKSNVDLLIHKEKAVETYHNTIGQMPANGEWWAKLAYAKAALGKFDKEFYLAYERALIYGGREYYINVILMNIGFSFWYSMNVDSRLIFKKAIINAYRFNAYAVLRLAQEYGQLRMICIWARDEGSPHKICEKELSK